MTACCSNSSFSKGAGRIELGNDPQSPRGISQSICRLRPFIVARYDAKRSKVAQSTPASSAIGSRSTRPSRTRKRSWKCGDEFGTFDKYIWQFVGGKPKVNRFESMQHVSRRHRESDAMSKDLQRRGFNFVGSTICYAYMQAVRHGQRSPGGLFPVSAGGQSRSVTTAVACYHEGRQRVLRQKNS